MLCGLLTIIHVLLVPVKRDAIEWVLRGLLSFELLLVLLHMRAEVRIFQGVTIWVLANVRMLIECLFLPLPLVED